MDIYEPLNLHGAHVNLCFLLYRYAWGSLQIFTRNCSAVLVRHEWIICFKITLSSALLRNIEHHRAAREIEPHGTPQLQGAIRIYGSCCLSMFLWGLGIVDIKLTATSKHSLRPLAVRGCYVLRVMRGQSCILQFYTHLQNTCSLSNIWGQFWPATGAYFQKPLWLQKLSESMSLAAD